MKKLYHLLVTSYKLHVTNLLCRISDIGYRISFVAFCFLPAAAFAQPPVPMLEAEVTDVVFSCPGTVEITYYLPVSGCVEVTLEYSPDKCTWNPVPGAEGDLGPQISGGSDKKITWDAAAHNASFGKLYFRVLYPAAPTCDELDGVMINGKCWAKTNLDVGGNFAIDHAYNKSALYQWGRLADGHAARNSTTYGTQSSTDAPGHDMFIIGFSDWRSSQNDFLWNSGTETCPVKTDFDPCPEHWRVPTRTELETLGTSANQTYVTKEWKTNFEVSGVNGWLCNDNSSGSSLFLPVTGLRYANNGTFNDSYTAYGFYWSSTPNGTDAYSLYFNSGNFGVAYYIRANGISVRCVKEN